MTKPRKQYIYIIGADDSTTPVKIGVSAKPKNRLRYLQTASPVKLKILTKFRGDKKDEAKLHQQFAAYRVSGEWFQRVPGVRLLIETRGMEHDNPWDAAAEELRKGRKNEMGRSA
jgi:Meiotically up-regulated gene 113